MPNHSKTTLAVHICPLSVCKPYISKEKIDYRRFVMCPLLAPHFKPFFLFFLAVTINSTNEANKAGSTQYSPLSNLYYLYVYGANQDPHA